MVLDTRSQARDAAAAQAQASAALTVPSSVIHPLKRTVPLRGKMLEVAAFTGAALWPGLVRQPAGFNYHQTKALALARMALAKPDHAHVGSW